MNTTARALPKQQPPHGLPQQSLPQLQQQTITSLEGTTDTKPFLDLYSTTQYPSAVVELSPPSPTSTASTTTSTVSTVSPSESSSASWLWPLPSQTDENRNEPSPERAPQNGPHNVGRPARRVQRCGVGQSRHGHGDRACRTQATLMEVRCWDHGCEGRKFSSLGNYRRHLREKNGQAKVHPCPDCGRVFTRSTARNFHRESGTCGLSPRQLMLQMQMQMQVQQTQPLFSSTASSTALLYPPLNGPSPLFDPCDWSSQMDLYSAPGVLLWGNGR